MGAPPEKVLEETSDTKRFSVIVPFGKAIDDWASLFARFAPLRPAMAELIVVLDGFLQNPPRDAPRYLKITSTPVRCGPAGARNRGAELAERDILAFTDDNCTPDPDWLNRISAAMGDGVDAVAGAMRIPPAGWLGDAISMLGYPCGGNLGFAKMWPVRPDSTTEHFSGCNAAIRAEAFRKAGGFDATFPFPGGEDNDLALRLRRQGSTIVFASSAVVSHPPRTGYGQLIRWQFRRGRGQSYLVTKDGLGTFDGCRLMSAVRIMGATWRRPYFVAMPILLVTVLLAQLCGIAYELAVGGRKTKYGKAREPGRRP